MSKKLYLKSSEKLPWVTERSSTSKNVNDNFSSFYGFFENMIAIQKDNFKLPHIQVRKNCFEKSKLIYDSKNSPHFCPISNISTVARLTRNRSNRFSNLRQLPVIEEEDGYCSEDNLDIRNYFYSNSELKNPYLHRKTMNMLLNNKFGKKVMRKKTPVESYEEISKTLSNLSPVVNINCLMNSEVKQTQPIWETNFGKRLLSGKPRRDIFAVSPPNLTKNEEENLDGQKEGNWWSTGSNQSTPSKCSKITQGTLKTGGGDMDDENSKRSSKNIIVKHQKKRFPEGSRHPKKKNGVMKRVVGSDENTLLEKKYIAMDETGSKESQMNFVNDVDGPLQIRSSSVILSSPSTVSKQQHFLTECVRNILQYPSDEFTCETCNDSFENVTKLIDHRKSHEKEKQSCLICQKEFFKGDEFIQHLLAHESVDKFSCKKCRKYIPGLDAYKDHMLKFHVNHTEVSKIYPETRNGNRGSQNFEKHERRYECGKCKMAFETEEEQRAHKRLHIKMNLTVVKHLCPDNVGFV